MNDKLQSEIQARIAAFSAEITAVLQRAVADSIGDALQGARVKRGPGRPPKNPGASSGRRVDTDAVLREIKREGGRRSEELARSLGTSTKALRGAIKELLDTKKVKTKGQARGTKYSAA